MGLKKFLGKHAGELAGITSVLGAVVGALPIDRQDKRNLGETIAGLNKAAASIAKSADEMPAFDVAIDKKVIREVLEEMLPDILGGIAEKIFAEAAKADEAANPVKAALAKAGKPVTVKTVK